MSHYIVGFISDTIIITRGTNKPVGLIFKRVGLNCSLLKLVVPQTPYKKSIAPTLLLRWLSTASQLQTALCPVRAEFDAYYAGVPFRQFLSHMLGEAVGWVVFASYFP